MTLHEAKATAQRLFRGMHLDFERENGACVVRIRATGTKLGGGGSWLEAMRSAALNTTKCASVEQLVGRSVEQASPRAPLRRAVRPFAWVAAFFVFIASALRSWRLKRRLSSGRSSDQPGLISQASQGQHPGPLSTSDFITTTPGYSAKLSGITYDEASSKGRTSGFEPVNAGSIPAASSICDQPSTVSEGVDDLG